MPDKLFFKSAHNAGPRGRVSLMAQGSTCGAGRCALKHVVLLLIATRCFAQTPDWSKVDPEALRHFQALVQFDTTDPPGNETRVAEYVKKSLDAEAIPSILAAKDPARANVIARLKGNGSKRPLLIMGHSDTVRVDPPKWQFGPF